MKTTLYILVLSCFWLVGCVQFKSNPVSAGASSAAFSGRSLNDAGLQKFLSCQAAGGSWTADKLALAASYYNGSVAVARAQADY